MSGGPVERFDPAALTDLADPYPVYRRYREAEPVHLGVPPTRTRPSATWYLFGHAEVARALAGRDFGRIPPHRQAAALVPAGCPVLRSLVENWLVFLDPPDHTRLRSLLAPAFTTAAVAPLRPVVRQIADRLVGALAHQAAERSAGRAVIDLVAGFAAPLPLLVICELLGVPSRHQAWFRSRALALQDAGSTRGAALSGGHARAERAAGDLAAYFQEELSFRRRTGDSAGLVSALLHMADHDAVLTVREAVATCVHLLTAGHETTTNLLAKAVLVLRGHHRVLDELAARPDLLPRAVGELLRYDAPVQMVTRWVRRDTELGSRAVRRGDRLVLVLGSANRDPARFEAPDTLDIHRDTGQHCGFGRGIHYCLGAALARAEAEVGLSALLTGLPMLHPDARWDIEAEYARDWVFHGPSRLTLTGPPEDAA